jgi:hypothetical protein
MAEVALWAAAGAREKGKSKREKREKRDLEREKQIVTHHGKRKATEVTRGRTTNRMQST